MNGHKLYTDNLWIAYNVVPHGIRTPDTGVVGRYLNHYAIRAVVVGRRYQMKLAQVYVKFLVVFYETHE